MAGASPSNDMPAEELFFCSGKYPLGYRLRLTEPSIFVWLATPIRRTAAFVVHPDLSASARNLVDYLLHPWSHRFHYDHLCLDGYGHPA
jgi:hypothetical protein